MITPRPGFWFYSGIQTLSTSSRTGTGPSSIGTNLVEKAYECEYNGVQSVQNYRIELWWFHTFRNISEEHF